MKLLSCEKKGTVYKLNLFGKEIKITIRSLERKIKDIDKRLCALEHHIFLWANAEHMTKSDRRCFVSKKFYEILGFFPDIDNPKTFYEKLHWMNENYYDPNEERCYDKLEFKKYVEERFGTGYTVNLLGGGTKL